jgi:hypothetical protein
MVEGVTKAIGVQSYLLKLTVPVLWLPPTCGPNGCNSAMSRADTLIGFPKMDATRPRGIGGRNVWK